MAYHLLHNGYHLLTVDWNWMGCWFNSRTTLQDEVSMSPPLFGRSTFQTNAQANCQQVFLQDSHSSSIIWGFPSNIVKSTIPCFLGLWTSTVIFQVFFALSSHTHQLIRLSTINHRIRATWRQLWLCYSLCRLIDLLTYRFPAIVRGVPPAIETSRFWETFPVILL